MRYSCADYSWPALSQPVVLDLIADLGFEGVDVAVFGTMTSVTVPELVARPLERADELLALTEPRGLAVADVFLTGHHLDLTRLSPTSRHDGDVAELRSIYEGTVEFAAAVGSGGVTLLPGVVEEGVSRDEAFARSAESLSVLIDIAGERGLAVSVEPHLGSIIPTASDVLELVSLTPGLTITLDPAHLVHEGGSLADEVLPLVPVTRHLQARFGGPGAMQSRLEDNAIDYPAVIAALAAAGYDGWLASEFVWMQKWDCDRVDNTAESARMLRYLRDAVAAL
ncbi:sugar phosphate isomerase/epimerase family protein [Schumannella luteola]